MTLLAKRYARALFEAADEAGVAEVVAKDLEALRNVLTVEEISAVVLSPATPAGVRRKALDKITETGHQLTRNVVGVICERRRSQLLPQLFEAFEELRYAKQGIATGVLETARPLAQAELDALDKAAAELVGKQVYLTVRENPELLGGVRLRVGNTLYDGSVATALVELEKQLLQASL